MKWEVLVYVSNIATYMDNDPDLGRSDDKGRVKIFKAYGKTIKDAFNDGETNARRFHIYSKTFIPICARQVFI